MLTVLSAVRRWLMRINAFGAGLMMLVVFGIVFANATWRYSAGKSIVWGEDVAVFAMIFGIMFGMALAYLQDGHVRFQFATSLVPKRWHKGHRVLIDVLVLAVGIGLAWSAFEFMSSRGGRLSPSTGIPMGVFQSAVLMGGVLLSLSALTMGLWRFVEQKAVTE
ncbi:TRAP transporter small permease [Saccharospirillum mangrovi]|uniref:TRAP transporter small permease n=1 Tax=Saccharospirillum mangrovi TaxID=2161747 RepID=UPI000D3C0C16|nr:TRAP transporter small permease [Saccharospirillum mangrovi]